MTIERKNDAAQDDQATAQEPQTPPDPEAERAALLAEMEAAEAEATGDEPQPTGTEGEPTGEGDDEGKADDGEGNDGKPEGEPAAEGAQEPEGGKPSDEFGELAKDTKADTRERFEKLKAGYDELHAKAQQYEAAHKRMAEWEEIITESTARPEQLNEALHLIRAINSNDPGVLEKAYGALEQELAAIGKRIGREAPGYDPLAEHQDLREAVEVGDMTRKHAAEVAKARALAAQHQAAAQQHQQQATSQQQAQHAQQAALAEVNELNARLKAEDPAGFAHRVKAIDYAEIRKHPPHLWAAKIEAAYWRAAPPAPKVPAAPSPLRPSAAGGRAMTSKPTSALEAVEAALSEAGYG